MNSLFLALAFVAVAAFFGCAGFYLGCKGAYLHFTKTLKRFNDDFSNLCHRRQGPCQQFRKGA